MKPGHTVYFRDEDEHVKAVVSIGIQFDHKAKDCAIELSNLIDMDATGLIDVINPSVAETKRHEREYMDNNSRLYDRSSE